MKTSIRLALSIMAALAVMGGLAWSLQGRMDGRRPVGPLALRPARIELAPKIRDTEVQSNRREKPKVRDESARAPFLTVGAPAIGAVGPGIVSRKVASAFALEPGTVGPPPDQALYYAGTPLTGIAAEYPTAAAEHGIEGWVILQIMLTRAGTVDDAAVIASEPPGVFEAAALDALRRWRIPEIRESIPAEQRAVRVLLRFRLENKLVRPYWSLW